MTQIIEKVTVPEGKRGPWSIQRFEVTKDEARRGALYAMIHGRGSIQPGVYTRLLHQQRGLIMSDSPDEMRDHYEAVFRAKGHVLINGLGIGMVLSAVLKKPEVTKVTVIEICPDLITLIGPYYHKDPRVEIICADAYTYQPPKGIRYGAVWHDVWDDMCTDHLPLMSKLKRKYGRRTDWQGCWGEEYTRRYGR